MKVLPCPNCKETTQPCACRRNLCVKCGQPVGNVTFSWCDDCFDASHRLKLKGWEFYDEEIEFKTERFRREMREKHGT